METVILVLSVVALVGSIVFAWLVYELFRLAFGWFRSRADSEDAAHCLALRLSDRVLGVLIFLAFLGLAL